MERNTFLLNRPEKKLKILIQSPVYLICTSVIMFDIETKEICIAKKF